MRDKIINILNLIKKGVDFEKEDQLIDRGILQSFEIISLVGKLSNEFDVDITVAELIPENFNSVDAMVEMIEELMD